MLIRFGRRVLRFVFDEEPVTPDGRLFVPRTGIWDRAVPFVERRTDYGWTPLPVGFGRGDITASGMFVVTWLDTHDTTQLTIDLDVETNKVAIFTSSVTPNFSTDTAYNAAPYNANEAYGGSWAQGGYTVLGTTWLEDPAGTVEHDATDVSQATSTFTGGEGSLYYADAITTPTADPAICLHDFGTTASPNNGTMQINWAAGGLFNIDITP